MDLGIKGKNALITGGTRGLGLASLKSLSNEGVNVAFCSRSDEGLNETSKILDKKNVKYIGIKHEIKNDINSLTELVNKAEKNIGNIDILVNNVGGSLGSDSLLNDDIENYERLGHQELLNDLE